MENLTFLFQKTNVSRKEMTVPWIYFRGKIAHRLLSIKETEGLVCQTLMSSVFVSARKMSSQEKSWTGWFYEVLIHWYSIESSCHIHFIYVSSCWSLWYWEASPWVVFIVTGNLRNIHLNIFIAVINPGFAFLLYMIIMLVSGNLAPVNHMNTKQLALYHFVQ